MFLDELTVKSWRSYEKRYHGISQLKIVSINNPKGTAEDRKRGKYDEVEMGVIQHH